MGWGTGVPVGFAVAAGGWVAGLVIWYLTNSVGMTCIFALAGAGVAGWYTYKKVCSL